MEASREARLIRKEPIPVRRGERPGSTDSVFPAAHNPSVRAAAELALEAELDSVLTLAEEDVLRSEVEGRSDAPRVSGSEEAHEHPLDLEEGGAANESGGDSPRVGPLGPGEQSEPPMSPPRPPAPEPSPSPPASLPDPRARALERRFLYHEVLGGKYRLEKSIARGGMGWVFLATQLPLGREVAVKVVIPQPGDPAFLRRFLLEASTCAKLSHPNIVTIHDYGQTHEGEVFMAMEYLHGRSLSQTLAREKRIEPERACRIVLHVLRALRAAHRAGVVHRDLKPSNVMLLEDTDGDEGFDFVKVVDFGLAKLFEAPEEPDGLQLTRAGMLLGSPRYMAPEQIRNRDVDPRTDVYALGVIFFYMLTGRVPFDGDHPTEILTQHLRDPAPSVSSIARDLNIPLELEQIVARCLNKRPEDRYQTVDALLVDLKAAYPRFAEDSPVSALVSADVSAAGVVAASRPHPPGEAPLERSFHEPTQGGASGTVSTEDRSGLFWFCCIVLFAVVLTLAFWAVILP